MADTVAELEQRGWHLSEGGYEECSDDKKRNVQATIKSALDFDLRTIAKKFLPDDINKGKLESIDGPCVLQIQKIRNISAPKDNEESQTAPRLLKISLSDGHITCNGIEAEQLTQISLGTPPGTKVLISGNVRLNNSFLQLTNNNTKVLGGRVEKMVESWELKRTLAKQSRSTGGGEDGPPPFIPFGQRVDKSRNFDRRKENFKSLETNKVQKKPEDDEFEQQRQATIAEALQAKEDGKTKMFGKQVSDKDVSKIVEMGFTPDQAFNALKQTGGNVEEAINSLLGASRPGYNRDYNRDGYGRDGRGRGRGQDRGDRPGFGRSRRGMDEDGYEPSRPSQSISLFDFLETKIPVKEESNKENNPSDRTRHKSDPKQSQERKPLNLPPRLQKLQAQKEIRESLSTKNEEAYPELSSAKNDRDNKKSNDKRDSKSASSKYPQSRRDNEQGAKYQPNQGGGNRRQNYEQSGRGGYNQRGQRYDNRQSYENNSEGRSQTRGSRNNDNSRHDQNFDRQFRYSGRNYQDGRYNDGKNFHDRQNHQGGGRNYQDGGGGGGRNYQDGGGRYQDGQRYPDRNEGRQYQDNKRQNDRPRNQYRQQQQQQQQQQNTQNFQAPPAFNNQPYPNQRQNRYENSRPYDGPPPQQQQQQQQQQHQKRSYVNHKQPQPIEAKPPVMYEEQTIYENPPPMSMAQQPTQEPPIMTPTYSSTQYVMVSQNEEVPVIYSQAISQPELVQHQPIMYAQANAPFVSQPATPNARQWKQGDYCQAKYWEDGKFYKAIIQNLYVNMNNFMAASVHFVEYGNVEEVILSDIKPISKEAWGDTPFGSQPVQAPQYIMAPQSIAMMAPPQMIADPYQGYVGTMEFTRGGNGVPVPEADRRPQPRANQQLYQPPPYRQ